jgi:hypothetical protein
VDISSTVQTKKEIVMQKTVFQAAFCGVMAFFWRFIAAIIRLFAKTTQDYIFTN